MSRTFVRTPLDGWDGPTSTEELLAFTEVLDAAGFNAFSLDQICASVPGRINLVRITTRDRYTWFWGIWYRVPGGEIMIAIPWSQDWKKSGGTQFDRGLNLYTTGRPHQAKVAALLTELTASAREYFVRARELKKNSIPGYSCGQWGEV